MTSLRSFVLLGRLLLPVALVAATCSACSMPGTRARAAAVAAQFHDAISVGMFKSDIDDNARSMGLRVQPGVVYHVVHSSNGQIGHAWGYPR